MQEEGRQEPLSSYGELYRRVVTIRRTETALRIRHHRADQLLTDGVDGMTHNGIDDKWPQRRRQFVAHIVKEH